MRKIKLSQCGSYVTKERINSNKLNVNNYITTDNMLPNKEGICDAEKIPTNITVNHFQENDILLSNIRPYFKKIWKAEYEGGCSADVLIFRTNSGYNADFIRYCLSQDAFFDYDMKGAKGSKMPRGDKNHILNFELYDFSLPSQTSIASVLKVLDNKIILNNKINNELEQMAKTLYDYWFVQFDFPDEKGRPYKSANGKMVYNEVLKREIPEGWEVGTLRDICKIIRGVSYDKKVISDMYLKEFTPIFRANNIDNGHINYDSLVYVPNNLINSSQIIRKNDVIMTMSSGSLNHLGKTYKSKTNMNCSYGAFCSKITPTDNYRHYLSSFLSSRSFQIYIKNMCLGTNINNLNNDHIYSAPICIPNTSLLDSFNSIADTIFSEIGKNEQENIELVQVRDFLLPLLMNGQVSVQN